MEDQMEWTAYKLWLQTEAACTYCHRRYSEPRDPNRLTVDVWRTETDCGCIPMEKRTYNAAL